MTNEFQAWRTHTGKGRWSTTFGSDLFGRSAEWAARFFGSPLYLVLLTVTVTIWIVVNGVAVALRWDPFPFILLNLAFSTQSAYAAPLMLLAETRQSERDKASAGADLMHRRELEAQMLALLEHDVELTSKISVLTQELRDAMEEVRHLARLR